MYKVKDGLAPSIVDEKYLRRKALPIFNAMNYGKHSLRYQGPHIWSKLDNKLKGS